MTSHLTDEARAFYIDQTPMRRPASLEEVAAVVRFLMSEEASYMNGTVIPVDGGSPRSRDPDPPIGSPRRSTEQTNERGEGEMHGSTRRSRPG